LEPMEVSSFYCATFRSTLLNWKLRVSHAMYLDVCKPPRVPKEIWAMAGLDRLVT